MKKRMIKLMTIFCMAGILTVNPAIIGLAEEAEAVGADVSEDTEEVEEKSVEEETEPEEEPAAEEDSVENNQVVITSTEENVPVVMDLLPDVVKRVEINWNDNDSSPKRTINENKNQVETQIKLNDDSATRSGYDFIGWYKNGTFLSGSDDKNYTYTFTTEDVTNGNIIFTAGWRQKVDVTVDDAGTASTLNAKAGSTASQATYDLKTVTEQLNKPDDSYVFANKWVVNGEGPYDAANDTMTVMFAQTGGNLVFNAVKINVDGQTNVETNNTINLTSCWSLVDGQYNLWIENKTTGTLTANEIAAKDGIIDIENVSNDRNITLKVNGWTLEKPVSDLAKGSTKYVKKNGKYYQYRESTITDQDFEKTVTYTYKDDFADTTFSNTGTGTATIHPGVEGQTWASILPKDAAATRGDFKLAGWKYFLNEKNIDPATTDIDFYKNDEHSLTVKPIWHGSYCYKPNYPTNQGPEKDPEVQEQEVGTEITLQPLDNISERYTFEGWLDSDGNLYKGGKSYRIEKANEIFTGQWKAVPHKLKFVDEDKSVYSEGTADFNTPIIWPSKPTKEGYTFQNWLVEIDKDEMLEVEHGEKFMMQDHDITFTAQWSINSYKISYDGNGAAMGVPAETVEQNYQTDYTIDTVVPTKTGYTFQGWSDGTTTYQPGAVFKVPARDVVLTAQWKANSHKVKYDGNGGKTIAPESKSVDYNSNVSVAAGLEKDGYLFDGWEQISTGKVLTPGASFVMPDMDETLKAKWKIAYTGINGKGTFYLVSGQSYTLGAGLKVQGDNSSYSGNMTFYVPQSGYYTFE